MAAGLVYVFGVLFGYFASPAWAEHSTFFLVFVALGLSTFTLAVAVCAVAIRTPRVRDWSAARLGITAGFGFLIIIQVTILVLIQLSE